MKRRRYKKKEIKKTTSFTVAFYSSKNNKMPKKNLAK